MTKDCHSRQFKTNLVNSPKKAFCQLKKMAKGTKDFESILKYCETTEQQTILLGILLVNLEADDHIGNELPEWARNMPRSLPKNFDGALDLLAMASNPIEKEDLIAIERVQKLYNANKDITYGELGDKPEIFQKEIRVITMMVLGHLSTESGSKFTIKVARSDLATFYDFLKLKKMGAPKERTLANNTGLTERKNTYKSLKAGTFYNFWNKFKLMPWEDFQIKVGQDPNDKIKHKIFTKIRYLAQDQLSKLD